MYFIIQIIINLSNRWVVMLLKLIWSNPHLIGTVKVTRKHSDILEIKKSSTHVLPNSI